MGAFRVMPCAVILACPSGRNGRRCPLTYVLERLPAILQLSAGALAFAMLTGIPLGMLASLKRLTLWDHGAMGIALLWPGLVARD